ncbi:response regulator, partial [archaeon]|nr:response regulator [archaeon]
PDYNGLFQILTAADRARKLTRQLLAFGSKQVLDMKTVDLGDIVESYSRMMERTIRENIEIRLNRDPFPASVQVDTDQIGQVIMNLIINAQDSMPTGGTITIGTTLSFIDQPFASAHEGINPGEHVMLSVSDTGTGMEKETLDHIFEPFFTTKEKGKGTGLGLATVYGIVIQHKGHITVYSEPGIGTTFKIYLPKAAGRTEKLSSKADILNGKRGNETILVAEDDTGVRNLTCEILRKHGYTIITEASTRELIDAAEREIRHIHLMLTDVIMPGMNGKELYEHIKPGHPEMKVLYMSGYTDDIIAHHGILDVDTPFLQKPFSVLALTEMVRKVLGG